MKLTEAMFGMYLQRVRNGEFADAAKLPRVPDSVADKTAAEQFRADCQRQVSLMRQEVEALKAKIDATDKATEANSLIGEANSRIKSYNKQLEADYNDTMAQLASVHGDLRRTQQQLDKALSDNDALQTRLQQALVEGGKPSKTQRARITEADLLKARSDMARRIFASLTDFASDIDLAPEKGDGIVLTQALNHAIDMEGVGSDVSPEAFSEITKGIRGIHDRRAIAMKQQKIAELQAAERLTTVNHFYDDSRQQNLVTKE